MRRNHAKWTITCEVFLDLLQIVLWSGLPAMLSCAGWSFKKGTDLYSSTKILCQASSPGNFHGIAWITNLFEINLERSLFYRRWVMLYLLAFSLIETTEFGLHLCPCGIRINKPLLLLIHCYESTRCNVRAEDAIYIHGWGVRWELRPQHCYSLFVGCQPHPTWSLHLKEI